MARGKWDAVRGVSPLQLAACIAGGELVLYVSKSALAAVPGGLLQHCALSLPLYSVPSRVLVLDTFPTLPNGKVNLTALGSTSVLKAAKTVETAAALGGGLRQFATDSLGMVRELNAGGASIAREAAAADVVRAILMYGVIMDHFAGCADGSTCRMVMEDMVWRQPYESQTALKWLDVAVRMIGNYKTMAGFLMCSAYLDSGYANATSWGRGDTVTLLTYIQVRRCCPRACAPLCVPYLCAGCVCLRASRAFTMVLSSTFLDVCRPLLPPFAAALR